MKTSPSNRSPNILRVIREKVEQGRYRFHEHAVVRRQERCIEYRDILHVLKHGTHEEEKTVFHVRTQLWRYAIRGKTIDAKDELRVVASLEDEVVVITVIRLAKGR